MKIITCASWKGGTGKTSLTIASVETLKKMGKYVLVIDLDSNMSISLAYHMDKENYSSIDLLNGQLQNWKIQNPTGKIDFIPSDLNIVRLNNISDRVLKNQIVKSELIKDYDYIFIDPPGTMNALTRNALVAADKIIVPSMFSDIDHKATHLLFNEMEECGIESDITVVLNRYDEKRSKPGIENIFRQDEKIKNFLWSGRIPAMRSISRLTAELNTYSLKGLAKDIIEKFVEEVIL